MCREPLCLIAFWMASCMTRKRQSEITCESLFGTFSQLKSISTLYRSDTSLQNPAAATWEPRSSSLEECRRCDQSLNIRRNV